jgi:hypothetical protein
MEYPPQVCGFAKEKNTQSVTLDIDYQSGYLGVTETDANGCQLEPCKLWVEVKE